MGKPFKRPDFAQQTVFAMLASSFPPVTSEEEWGDDEDWGGDDDWGEDDDWGGGGNEGGGEDN